MRQWELFGITDSVPTWALPKPKQPDPPLDPAAGSEPAIFADGFPSTLWTTDAALRFTSAPGRTRVGVGGTDVLTAFGPDEGRVVEAHVRALAGSSSSFDLRRDGARFQCWVSPVRAGDGGVCGTICVGMALDADLFLDPEYA